MDSYLDFKKATEFVKYNREADNGQIIPESCCILEDNEAAKELFIAKDENCLIAPVSTNSYSSTVLKIFEFSRQKIGKNVAIETLDFTSRRDRKSKNKGTFSLEILYCSHFLFAGMLQSRERQVDFALTYCHWHCLWRFSSTNSRHYFRFLLVQSYWQRQRLPLQILTQVYKGRLAARCSTSRTSTSNQEKRGTCTSSKTSFTSSSTKRTRSDDDAVKKQWQNSVLVCVFELLCWWYLNRRIL